MKGIANKDVNNATHMTHLIEAEIQRIVEVRDIYLKLKKLIPGYHSDYLDAYKDIANTFLKIRNNFNIEKQNGEAGKWGNKI